MFLILSRKDVSEPKLTTHITSSTDCSGDSGTHFAPKFVCFKKINPAFQFCNAKVFERCRIAIVIEMSVFFSILFTVFYFDFVDVVLLFFTFILLHVFSISLSCPVISLHVQLWFCALKIRQQKFHINVLPNKWCMDYPQIH